MLKGYSQAEVLSKSVGSPPTRGRGHQPRGPGWQPLPPESSMSPVVSCWLLGCDVGFCLPSPPHANPLSRPHCLGNALQSPHKGKLHGEAGPAQRQGKSFHGNTDITRLSRLQSQALNGGAWVFTLQPRRGRLRGSAQCWGGPSSVPSPKHIWVQNSALPLTSQVTWSKPAGMRLSLLIY